MISVGSGKNAPKAPKRTHTKVKTGCKTCRARRVKCDEGFPVCQRCISSGRLCYGYGIWGGGGATQGVKTESRDPAQVQLHQPNEKATSKALLLSPISKILPGPTITSQEQIYLEWFIHGTATKLPKLFNTPTWEPLILQAAIQEPMIMNALLTFSACHNRVNVDPMYYKQKAATISPDAQEIFTWQQYGKAVRGLRVMLAEEKTSIKHRLRMTVIMCCLLTSVCQFRGRFEEALFHHKHGSAAMQQLAIDKEERKTWRKLGQYFAKAHDHMSAFWLRKQGLIPLDFKPADISSVMKPKMRHFNAEEAGFDLDAFSALMSRSAFLAKEYPPTDNASREMIDNEQSYLIITLNCWLLAYEATLAELTSELAPEERRAWEALRKRHDIAVAMAKAQMRETRAHLSEIKELSSHEEKLVP